MRSFEIRRTIKGEQLNILKPCKLTKQVVNYKEINRKYASNS